MTKIQSLLNNILIKVNKLSKISKLLIVLILVSIVLLITVRTYNQYTNDKNDNEIANYLESSEFKDQIINSYNSDDVFGQVQFPNKKTTWDEITTYNNIKDKNKLVYFRKSSPAIVTMLIENANTDNNGTIGIRAHIITLSKQDKNKYTPIQMQQANMVITTFDEAIKVAQKYDLRTRPNVNTISTYSIQAVQTKEELEKGKDYAAKVNLSLQFDARYGIDASTQDRLVTEVSNFQDTVTACDKGDQTVFTLKGDIEITKSLCEEARLNLPIKIYERAIFNKTYLPAITKQKLDFLEDLKKSLVEFNNGAKEYTYINNKVLTTETITTDKIKSTILELENVIPDYQKAIIDNEDYLLTHSKT
jgi:hypothetical protein